jgi:hypothetical protein
MLASSAIFGLYAIEDKYTLVSCYSCGVLLPARIPRKLGTTPLEIVGIGRAEERNDWIGLKYLGAVVEVI